MRRHSRLENREHCFQVPTVEELEVALAWAAGESDVMGKERHPLSGKTAELYDILMADEEWDEEGGTTSQ
jgi:hypothetical protein